MRQIIIVASIVCVFALSAPKTYACSCFVPDVPESFEKASDVFVGVVSEIIAPRTADEKAAPSDRFFTIKFKVEKSWKGRISSEISVLADQGRLGCFSFPTVFEGEKYLVYADPVYSDKGYAKGLVMINACNRTGLISEQLKQPVYGFEFRDWFGRRERTEDLKELDEITNTTFKYQFNRSLFRSKEKPGVKIGW